MDYEERYAMNEEARIDEEFQCECCGEFITGIEALDPEVIDGKTFCIDCASNLVELREAGIISSVSEKTAVLVHEFENELYYAAYDKINFPNG